MIYQLIDEMAGRGKAVLLVSRYLPELLGVCDRIAVMCRGRLGVARRWRRKMNAFNHRWAERPREAGAGSPLAGTLVPPVGRS